MFLALAALVGCDVEPLDEAQLAEDELAESDAPDAAARGHVEDLQAALAPVGSLPPSMLANASFEGLTVGVPLGTATNLIHETGAPFYNSTTGASSWTGWLNSTGQVLTWSSQLEATHGTTSLFVSAGAPNAGFGQAFTAANTQTNVGFEVDVLVLQGRVMAAIGNGGDTGGYAALSDPALNGTWQKLRTCGSPSGKNTTVIVYAYNAPAAYYVDNARLIHTCSYDPAPIPPIF